MKNVLTVIVTSAICVIISSCASVPGQGQTDQQQLRKFIDDHVNKIKPLEKEMSLAYWIAATTGKEEDFKKYSQLELKVRQIHSDPGDFAFLKKMKQSGKIEDPLLARQLDRLYNVYLENQIEPELLKEIVTLSGEIESNFSVFRGTIDGKKVTNNEISEILKTETDSPKREKAWQASKQVAPAVAADIVKLVKLRNQAARKLGFDNYHTLSLTTAEQSVEELDGIFEQLIRLTDKPFAGVKAELDGILSKMYGIAPDKLMPWHYHDPFFQESPMVYDLDLDIYYKGKNIKQLARKFYAGIGLPVRSILKNSDLYEREGKNPHAFCTDIDRQGDVRILCNIEDKEYWMEVTLHELGHGVYFKYHDRKVPYLIREPAHILTTEAIAMVFGRLSRNAAWMRQMLELSDQQRNEIEQVSRKYTQIKELIFVRWAAVMYYFEKQLYADPDQNLNALWWQMVEKYQLVNRPTNRDEPDWAAKIHFTIAPCYYHNYMLGDLMASQVHNYLVHNVLKLDSDRDVSYVDQPKVGRYLRNKIFAPAAIYPLNVMIERATVEPLTPKYFVSEFVK